MGLIFLNGLNFSEWSEQLQFYLGVLDLDLALLHDKPLAITETSSAEQRSFYNAWERSNRLNLMFMRITIVENIKLTIPNTDSAKRFMEYMKSMSQFDPVDKSVAGTLIGMLTTMNLMILVPYRSTSLK